MAFPTLSRDIINLDYQGEDNDIHSPIDAGYDHSRPRHTRNRTTITVEYGGLPATDKVLLLNHQESVGTHTPFDFYDRSNTLYSVKYVKRLKCKERVPGWWLFDPIVLREV